MQSVLQEAMKDHGGNQFKIPHMKKEKLAREGALPVSITCDSDIYNSALVFTTDP